MEPHSARNSLLGRCAEWIAGRDHCWCGMAAKENEVIESSLLGGLNDLLCTGTGCPRQLEKLRWKLCRPRVF
eukprot:1159899-Pelagomonas_calceolata.AAC.6